MQPVDFILNVKLTVTKIPKFTVVFDGANGKVRT